MHDVVVLIPIVDLGVLIVRRHGHEQVLEHLGQVRGVHCASLTISNTGKSPFITERSSGDHALEKLACRLRTGRGRWPESVLGAGEDEGPTSAETP